MARSRNIKPGFFESEQLGRCPLGARLLFIAMWQVADRDGKLHDRPMRLRAFAFPYDSISMGEVEAWIDALESESRIVRYSVDGHKYIFIPTFLKHQNPHFKEKKSEIPDIPGASPGQARGFLPTTTEKTLGKPEAFLNSSREKTVLTPDSGLLIPDIPIPGASPGQARGKPGASAPSAPFISPDEADFEQTPEYWAEKLREAHPKPSARRLVEQFCVDHWHRLGDAGRYRGYMEMVYASLIAWRASWEQTEAQYAPKLEAWLHDEGYRKQPPKPKPLFDTSDPFARQS